MGRIIVDLPQRIKRHYKIDDVESAAELLAALQMSAQRVTGNPAKLTAEDLADIRAAKRARKGDLISWEEAKVFLDRLDK